jgi:hypothetical protein
MSIKQRASIRIRLDEPTTLDELWSNYLIPIEHALSAATAQRNYVTELHIVDPTNDDRRSLEIFEQGIRHGHGEERMHPIGMPAPRGVLTFAQLAAWLKDAQELSGVSARALDAIFGVGYLETRLIEAAQAAEGLHRRCFEDERRIPRLRARELRAAFRELVTPNELEALDDTIASLGEPNLRTRLVQLGEWGGTALADVIPHIARWATLVKDARNDEAHQLVDDDGPEEVAPTNILQLFYLTQSTALCVLMILLIRCGVDRDVLRQRLSNVSLARSAVQYAHTLDEPFE